MAYLWKSVTPSSTNYWIVAGNDPEDYEFNIPLWQVTQDSFEDVYEEADHLLAGRGRKKEYGTRFGYAGSLTCQLRDVESHTAREQRLLLEQWKAERRTAYLRSPFGDVFLVALGNLGIGRMAGTGQREYCDLTIPYVEVSS